MKLRVFTYFLKVQVPCDTLGVTLQIIKAHKIKSD